MSKTMNPDKAMAQFINDRNRALVSLNEKRIKKYFRKWGIPYPTDEKVFWAAIHKAIVELYMNGGRFITEEHYKRSKQWLEERGMPIGTSGK